MEGLRDIKALVRIEDYSLYIFSFMIVCVIVLAVIAFLYFLKRLRKASINAVRKEAWNYLCHVDFKEAKMAAYGISQRAHLFVTEENRAHFEALMCALEAYKYKPIVPSFSERDKALLTEFLGHAHG
ncbi:MAG: hypothetical protein PHR87_11040 [Sulfurospirillaceae bacterium]|nr:hypothetical protein [Sulfurospirillaceae bacterium]